MDFVYNLVRVWQPEHQQIRVSSTCEPVLYIEWYLRRSSALPVSDVAVYLGCRWRCWHHDITGLLRTKYPIKPSASFFFGFPWVFSPFGKKGNHLVFSFAVHASVKRKSHRTRQKSFLKIKHEREAADIRTRFPTPFFSLHRSTRSLFVQLIWFVPGCHSLHTCYIHYML